MNKAFVVGAIASRKASSFACDIPWLSGVADRHWKSAACAWPTTVAKTKRKLQPIVRKEILKARVILVLAGVEILAAVDFMMPARPLLALLRSVVTYSLGATDLASRPLPPHGPAV